MPSSWSRKRLWSTRAVVMGGCLVIAAAALAQPDQKVVRRSVDYAVPNVSTVDERLGQVDAVLRVRIHKAGEPRPFFEPLQDVERAREIQAHPWILTYYDAEVLEVIKPHPRAGVGGITMPIIQVGGEADDGPYHFITITDVPRLAAGGDYLLFLSYHETFGGMHVQPFDIFRVDTESVEANESGKAIGYGKLMIGRGPGEVLELVRAAADRLATGVASGTPRP